MKRRSLLAGLVAAPAIVTAGNIMRINPKLALPPKNIWTMQGISDEMPGFFLGADEYNGLITGFQFEDGNRKIIHHAKVHIVKPEGLTINIVEPPNAKFMRVLMAN